MADAFAEIMLRNVGHEVVCVGRSWGKWSGIFAQWPPAKWPKDNEGKHWQPTGSKMLVFNNVKEITSALNGVVKRPLMMAIA